MFEERPEIQSRLDSESIAWMTTVDPSGQPQTSPVGFLAQGEVIVVYSRAKTPRTRNIEANPRVCLNLSTPMGGEVVIVEGTAEIISDGVPVNEDPEYMAKFAAAMEYLGTTPEAFAADYPVRIHIRPANLRAW